jgi:tetratricopeptide (TPR) repeat protein
LCLRARNNLGNLQIAAGQRPEALRSFQEALRIQTALVKDYPEVGEYQNVLASTHHNFGILQSEAGQRSEALRSYQEAVRIWTALVKAYPEVVQYQNDLANTLTNQGMLQKESSQYLDALTSFEQAMALGQRILQKASGHPTATFRLTAAKVQRVLTIGQWQRHIDALAQAGDHAQASKHADLLAGVKEVPGDTLYSLACIFALSANAAARDAKLPDTERQTVANKHAVRAVALLEQARVKGYFKDTEVIEEMKKDSDLDSLRQRPDYQKFLDTLAPRKPKD